MFAYALLLFVIGYKKNWHFSMAMYSRNANLQIFLSLYVKLSTDHLSTSNELSKVYVTDFMANLIFL